MDYGVIVITDDKQRPSKALAAMVHATYLHLGRGKVKLLAKGQGAPVLTMMTTKQKVFGEDAALRFLARLLDQASDAGVYPTEPIQAGQVDHMLKFAQAIKCAGDPSQLVGALNTHLERRTYLVGHRLTLADIAVWGAVASLAVDDVLEDLPHAKRWYDMCTAHTWFERASEKKISKEQRRIASKGSYKLKLQDAEMGKVVTRFPPEPSGYLHIGHAKAALLNHYFARAYQGTLLLRFDDTNPSKEKDDYVDNILKDLKTLGINYDKLSHTSDHFELIQKYAEHMLRTGKAYIDDTPREEMKAMRMDGIESPNRSNSVEKNLELWEEMKNGTSVGLKCCMRAKIDMQNKNKALRDPAIYRCNITPHHRTGSKYKVYPTYDFACPIVDSVEGVTHTLRTTEYHDRDPQYFWMCDALGLRKPHIWDYSKLQFVYTLMSKRKLNALVNKGVVDGWSDPRFPTIQGIVRRGLTVPALQDYVYSLGASRTAGVSEWGKLWTINKKHIDPTAVRYNAVAPGATLEIENGPSEVREVSCHPKNPGLGKRKMQFDRTVLLEPDDAKDIVAGEEVTLMSVGNVIVKDVSINSDGTYSLKGVYNPDGDVKSTKKKLHWVAAKGKHVPTTFVEYDHLLTVKKMEKQHELENVLRPNTKFETLLQGESGLANVKKGDFVQLQRRGFCRCDVPYDAKKGQNLVLFFVPDGKVKAMSTVSRQVHHADEKKEAAAPSSAPAQSSGKANKQKKKPRVKVAKSDVVIMCTPDTSVDKHDWSKIGQEMRKLSIHGVTWAKDFAVQEWVYGMKRLAVVCQIVDSQVESTQVICDALAKLEGVDTAEMVSIETAAVDWNPEQKVSSKPAGNKGAADKSSKKKKKKKKQKEKVHVVTPESIAKSVSKIAVAASETNHFVAGVPDMDGSGQADVTREQLEQVVKGVREKYPKLVLMVVAAGKTMVSALASVPEESKAPSATAWIESTLFQEVTGDAHTAFGTYLCDADRGEFTIKVKDQVNGMAFSYLRKEGLIVEDDSDDDMVFLDDLDD